MVETLHEEGLIKITSWCSQDVFLILYPYIQSGCFALMCASVSYQLHLFHRGRGILQHMEPSSTVPVSPKPSEYTPPDSHCLRPTMEHLLAPQPQPGQTILPLIPSATPTKSFFYTNMKTKGEGHINRCKRIQKHERWHF